MLLRAFEPTRFLSCALAPASMAIMAGLIPRLGASRRLSPVSSLISLLFAVTSSFNLTSVAVGVVNCSAVPLWLPWQPFELCGPLTWYSLKRLMLGQCLIITARSAGLLGPVQARLAATTRGPTSIQKGFDGHNGSIGLLRNIVDINY